MNSAIKIVVALLVAALIAVIGMIVITNQDAGEPAAAATTIPAETIAPEATIEPEAQPEESDKPEETADSGETSESTEAQDEAHENMYEGALAGLTEEEIAEMALAEEQSHGGIEDEEETGVEDAGD
ncbi:MAG: hypothetical protein IJD60_08870 [Clostridia bacterium]|nr:hypothetical protein [Clostridia bacterium]